MDKELRHISFFNLKQSYKTVKDFLETESGDEVKSLDTKIADDLALILTVLSIIFLAPLMGANFWTDKNNRIK